MPTLAQINALSFADFVRQLGPVFEHSPWIAEAAWAHRPFTSLTALHDCLLRMVQTASPARQLGLIRAHPDLAGRLAKTETLTRDSAGEQASAGLDHLSAEERKSFHEYNTAYRAKFGFPFVICARLNHKRAILEGFRERLQNPPAEEVKTALDEIGKIAYLRLKDIVEPEIPP